LKRIAFLLLLFSLAIPTLTAQAHPADMYAHTVTIAVTPAGLRINWVIKPGPVLTGFLWYEMDTDQDGTLSPREIEAWGSLRAAWMTASLDDKPLPLVVESTQLPGSLRAFQAGEEFITFDLSARWEPGAGNVQRLVIENGWEPQNSINWYYLNAEDDAAFLFPSQRSHTLAVDMIRDRNLLPDQSPLLTAWDSGTPSLPLGQQKDAVTETAEQIVPELAEQAPQDILLDLVRTREFSFAFYLVALLIALALGALHALTPGHGKTVVAAYLVGARGTSLHAVALGTVVTLTHTGSVFLLGIITLAASQYILPTTIVPFLEILSGVLIVGLGLYLLWQRFVFWRESRRERPVIKNGGGSMISKRVSFAPAASRKPTGAVKVQTPAAGMHHHGDGKMHSHEVPQHITWRSLIALGISGGLVPCPDAIAILLVAIAINRVMLGLMLILSFSLGLAVILIIIGLLMVNSRKLFDRFGFLDRLAPVMPLVSAVIVLALGFGLTWGAVVRAQGHAGVAAPVLRSVEEARVLYLSEDETRVKHLFITDYSRDTSRLLAQDVVEYAVAPGQDVIAYVILTGERENEIWLMDLVTMERNMILDCADAICSGLVWSPRGDRLIYERLNLVGNPVGLPTLWWIDLATGEDQPVFQEAQLPGGNPRWSPDGAWLSYATPEGIRLYHLQNGETRMIPNILGVAALWSPDGKRILLRDVVIRHGQFLTQLFLYDLATERLTNVTPEEGMENLLAAWSPDGEWIAVVRRDLAVPRGDQIWLMRADGSDASMITNDPDSLHGSLNWSPDGRYLLYDLYDLSVFPSVSNVRVMDLETGEVRDLGVNGFNPKWVW
jgi:nickel/cobalt transporter (NicO) family protein